MNDQTLPPFPNPGDWCTIDGAAAITGKSRRTISRWIEAGTLTGHLIEGAGHRHPILWKPEVRELADSIERVRRGRVRA